MNFVIHVQIALENMSCQFARHISVYNPSFTYRPVYGLNSLTSMLFLSLKMFFTLFGCSGLWQLSINISSQFALFVCS